MIQYNCDFIQENMDKGGQLIDVRSVNEFNMGALMGAINMPIEKCQGLKDAIDNTKPILLYCRTGARSEAVKNYLIQLGYNQVHNIGGLQQFVAC